VSYGRKGKIAADRERFMQYGDIFEPSSSK
jgi:hypothetical protein